MKKSPSWNSLAALKSLLLNMVGCVALAITLAVCTLLVPPAVILSASVGVVLSASLLLSRQGRKEQKALIKNRASRTMYTDRR